MHESFWQNIEHFGPHEWPAGALAHMDPRVIIQLDAFRDAYGATVAPSKLLAGHVRFEGSKTSRHYAVDRMADATDVHLDDLRKGFFTALHQGVWGGIGIYLDTNEPMMHLDLRPYSGLPLVWVRDGGEYKYGYKAVCAALAKL